MTFCVAVTDLEWYNNLSRLAPDDVNFWQPGGSSVLRRLTPGAPFLFKLKSPLNVIAGVGFFASHSILPLSLAWDIFELRNGVSSFEALWEVIGNLRRPQNPLAENSNIGCIVLSNPIFFEERDWIETPPNWSPNTQQYKYYDLNDEFGKNLWDRLTATLQEYLSTKQDEGLKSEFILHEPESTYTTSILRKVRLGQAAFRVMVTEAYTRRCAISGERTLPVLEAAHIKPYSISGPNFISNGLLLRSDIHKLFDSNYITVTPDFMVNVSRRIKEEFENGKEYYRFHGRQLATTPSSRSDVPLKEFLDWHNERFKG